MNRTVKTHLAFLDLLNTTSTKQRRALLLTMTPSQMQTLCEVMFNVYKGTIPVSKQYIKTLYPYKNVISTLVSRTVNKSQRKKFLLKHQSIIPRLIKTALHLFQNGSRTSSRSKRKIPKTDANRESPSQKHGDTSSVEEGPALWQRYSVSNSNSWNLGARHSNQISKQGKRIA